MTADREPFFAAPERAFDFGPLGLDPTRPDEDPDAPRRVSRETSRLDRQLIALDGYALGAFALMVALFFVGRRLARGR